MSKPFDSIRRGDLRGHPEELEGTRSVYLEYLQKNFRLGVHNCGGELCARRGVVIARQPIRSDGPPLNAVTDFIFSPEYNAGRNIITKEARAWMDTKSRLNWTKKDCIDFRFDEAKELVAPTFGLTLVCEWPEGLRAEVYTGLKRICGTTKVASMVFHALNPEGVAIIDRKQIWRQFKQDFEWGSKPDDIDGIQFDEFCERARDSLYEAIGRPRGADLVLHDQSSLKAWNVEDLVNATRLPVPSDWTGRDFDRRYTLGKLADDILRSERPSLKKEGNDDQ